MPTCHQCGLSYVSEVLGDRRYHKKFHDEVVHGLPADRIRTDRIVWERGDQLVTVINSHSPLVQQKRAERIGRLSHRDSNFDFPPYVAGSDIGEGNVHVFLGYQAGRGIGFFLLERLSHIWKCNWIEYSQGKAQELPDHAPMWSVGYVWVHRAHRMRGWARLLAEQASCFLGIDVQSLGWYTPFTDEGEAMAKRLCPDEFYVAK